MNRNSKILSRAISSSRIISIKCDPAVYEKRTVSRPLRVRHRFGFGSVPDVSVPRTDIPCSYNHTPASGPTPGCERKKPSGSESYVASNQPIRTSTTSPLQYLRPLRLSRFRQIARGYLVAIRKVCQTLGRGDIEQNPSPYDGPRMLHPVS